MALFITSLMTLLKSQPRVQNDNLAFGGEISVTLTMETSSSGHGCKFIVSNDRSHDDVSCRPMMGVQLKSR